MNATTVYERMLGSSTDAFLRRMAINFAIVGFLLHLLCCVLYDFKVIESDDLKSLFDSYLDALYTPFSIILAYEVYELIRAIPESFSNSIGKQFEVVTLLVVRDIFKNLADLGGADNITIDADVAFIAVEAVAFVVLFGTALYFRGSDVRFEGPSTGGCFHSSLCSTKENLGLRPGSCLRSCCIVFLHQLVLGCGRW